MAGSILPVVYGESSRGIRRFTPAALYLVGLMNGSFLLVAMLGMISLIVGDVLGTSVAALWLIAATAFIGLAIREMWFPNARLLQSVWQVPRRWRRQLSESDRVYRRASYERG